MNDQYFTIKTPATVETKVKGSRFIATSHLVESSDDAAEMLNSVRKTEYAATHNCYGWRAGIFDKAEFKYSDDGEPSGTAGRPIYDVILGSKIDNLLIVVTRYFGGTKLGTGGLVRAYSEAAQLVLERSGRSEHFLTDTIRVEIEFPLYDQLLRVMHGLGAKQIEADFSDHVRIDLSIRQSMTDKLTAAIVELSAGKAKIEK